MREGVGVVLFFFCLTCGSAGGKPPLIQRLARKHLPVQMCGMYHIPLTPIAWTTSEAFSKCLQPGATIALEGFASMTHISSPARPALGLCSGWNQQPHRGSMGHVGFIVLRDWVVPDFSFVVCIVLFCWVDTPGVRRHLGLTNTNLNYKI